jgi:DNA (cytosine-5)-methyltransferase 1
MEIYELNHGADYAFSPDITKTEASDIPDHDILLAGFPCQSFSIAGLRQGFADATRGTLFFDILRILKEKRPKAFLLENVKGLTFHDKGKTLSTILDALELELGYDVRYKVISAEHWVPQKRNRIYIVGFRERSDFSWEQVKIPKEEHKIAHILHKTDESEPVIWHDHDRYYNHFERCVQPKYTLTDEKFEILKAHKKRHDEKGHAFGYSLYTGEEICRTLCACDLHRYYLVDQSDKGLNPRKFTPREYARLMGFPDSFILAENDLRAHRHLGNSVVVPVISAIAKAMLKNIA